MRKAVVCADTPKIIIGGMEFEQKMSDGEIYAAGRAVLADCLKLDVTDECAVLNVLRNLCGFIDETLGAGSMKKIVGDKAVTLPMALKVINEIIRTCGERYAAYIRREYTGGKRNEKLQPVKP